LQVLLVLAPALVYLDPGADEIEAYELLERENYFCKISIIDATQNITKSVKTDMLTIIPLFSHREPNPRFVYAEL